MFHPECNLSGTTKQVCECATFYYFLFTCPFFVIQKWVMQCTAYLFEIYLFTVFIGQLYSNSMDLGVNNVNDVCLRNGTTVCSQNSNFPKSADLHEAPRGRWWLIKNIYICTKFSLSLLQVKCTHWR